MVCLPFFLYARPSAPKPGRSPCSKASRHFRICSGGKSHHRKASNLWIVSSSYRFRMGLARHAAHDGIGLHIPSDHCPGADDGAVPDVNAGEDDGFIADPDVVPDHDVPPVVPGRRDLGNRASPTPHRRWETDRWRATAACGSHCSAGT